MNLLLNNDWITFVFLAIFVLLGVCKFFYNERLLELFVLFLSKRYLIKYTKDIQPIFNVFNAIYFVAFIAILGLMGLAIVQFYYSDLYIENSLLFYLKIMLGIASYFSVRFLIGYGLASIFDLKNEQQTLSFVKMSYFFSAALVVFPLLIFVFFLKSYNLLFFKLSLFIFCTLLIARYIIVFNYNKNVVKKNWFNFFLYLCALEIAPLLVISKMII